ncbi:MAG TPA: flagellar hook-basal body complex protein FliE [Gemmatimonadaceae bacterium]|nr:flagellar hook-basal body complex protein FliE [Gemmatimonadaceae bacterium]
MSDPIGAVASRLATLQGGGFGGGVGGSAGGGGVAGPDAPRRYTFDIGKGDGTSAGAAGGPSFGETLTTAINQVSDAQDRSSALTQQFLRGENVELHQVMAAGEEAGIALELMIELRNKFTDAYRTLINMQS